MELSQEIQGKASLQDFAVVRTFGGDGSSNKPLSRLAQGFPVSAIGNQQPYPGPMKGAARKAWTGGAARVIMASSE